MTSSNGRFTASWSEEDQEWIGRCHAFPSLSWLAPSQDEALSGIQALVEEGEGILQDRGRLIAGRPSASASRSGEDPAFP